jgi:hypothetical protein
MAESTRKFVFFATVKNIEKHIDTYRQMLHYFEQSGCQVIDPWLVKNYPHKQTMLDKKIITITEDSHKQLSRAEFAVCEFSEKSRTVIFQAMLAMEKKIPLLCLVERKNISHVPDLLSRNQSGLVTVKVYQDSFELRECIKDFLGDIAPIKKRFNVMLTMSTLKELEILSQKLELPKAEIIRRLITKEYDELHK